MRLRRHFGWRWTAKGLVLALVLQWSGAAIAQAPATVTPAPAGEASPALTQLVILDFEVPAGQSPLLGRKAADAVAVAFLNMKAYGIVSRMELEAAMKRLRLTYPLTPAQLIQLTKEVQARYAITGRVVRVSVDAKKGQASVQLQMLFHDPYMEVPVNGAHVLATTPPRPDTPPEVLVDQALNLAAAQAVQQAMSVRLPEGQITQRTGRIVIINRGHDQGIRERMSMWVVRTTRTSEGFTVPVRVGRIIITETGARTSEGVIEEEVTPVQYPDKVVAVYQLPSLAAPEVPVRIGKKGTGAQLGRLLLLLAAVFLIGTLAGRHESRRGERAPAPLSPRTDSTGRQIVVPLSRLRDAVAIEIYRGTAANINVGGGFPIDIVDPQGVSVYVDTDQFYAGEAVIDVEEQFGEIQGPPPAALPRLVRTLADEPSDEFERRPEIYTRGFLHTPIQLGEHYWYAFQYVTARRVPINPFPTPTGGGGGGGGGGAAKLPYDLKYSSLSGVVGPATPVRRLGAADLIQPAQDTDVNVRDITFRFLSALGADEYVVEVSDDLRFPSNRTFRVPAPLLPNPDQDAQPITLPNQNIEPFFMALTGASLSGRTFFWRVGYRHSRDAQSPEGGFVFSEIRRFRAAQTPPGPPG